MIRKFNKKQLFIVCGVLAVLYLIQIGLGSNSHSNLPVSLTSYSTGQVDKIEIWRPSNGQEVMTLFKKDNLWQVQGKLQNGSYQADSNKVKSLLRTLNDLKPIRLASNEKKSWKSFNVNDSTGTRIRIQNQDKTLADVYIGRFSYTQSPMQAQMQQQNPYMQQNPGTMSTYVRLADNDKVFAVEGFLGSEIHQHINDFRDKSILTLPDQEKLRELAFSYPADSSFVLRKQANNWMTDEIPADSVKMASFLNQIKELKVRDLSSKRVEHFSHQLKLTFTDGSIYTLQGFFENDTATIISSQYPDNIGLDPSGTLFKKVFKNQLHFLK